MAAPSQGEGASSLRRREPAGVSEGDGEKARQYIAAKEKREKDIEQGSPKDAKDKKATSTARSFLKETLTPADWVLANYRNVKSWKIIFRCAVASWVGLLLVLCRPSQNVLGTASFLVLIVSFILPPSNPVALCIEQYFVATLFVAFSWGYSCIFIRIACLARSEFQYASQAAFGAAVGAQLAAQGVPAAQISSEVQATIFAGNYIEAGSSVVSAVGFAIFAGIALFVRGWIGPSPYVFGVILSIICASICLLFNPLFPYPFYMLGYQFFLPFICQIAINLVCAILIFPDNLHDQFLDRLQGVVTPLQKVLKEQEDLLSTHPDSEDWANYKNHKVLLAGATKSLGMLSVSESLLSRNISLQRASGRDLQELLTCVRALASRASGFTYFHDFLTRHMAAAEDANHELVIHFGRSEPPTRHGSPAPSIHASTSDAITSTDSARPVVGKAHSHGLLDHIFHHHGHGHTPRQSGHNTPKQQHQVGFMEAQAYMLLEKRMGLASDSDALPSLLEALRNSSRTFIKQVDSSIDLVMTALQGLRSKNPLGILKGVISIDSSDITSTDHAIRKLELAIHEYESTDRLEVVKAFAHLFDPDFDEDTGQLASLKGASHRGLFITFSYQWSLLQYARATLNLLQTLQKVQGKRRRIQLFLPHKLSSVFKSPDKVDGIVDEDPEVIDGVPDHDAVSRRNPDYLDPDAGSFRYRARWLTTAIHALTGPSMLFAYKAGIFSCLAAFPAFFASTASFYYKHRGIWVTIMVALTMNRWVADTTFQFVLRITGTFAGAVVGLLIWSIGNPHGFSPYGSGAVCAVAFPIMHFYRNFHPIVVQGILTIVTVVLVVGYSIQDATLPSAGTVGVGWDVAWRRFLLVAIGVTIAFVTAFIPPRSTQKNTLRLLYAKTLDANAEMLFQVISINRRKRVQLARLPARVIKSVSGLRARLLKSAASRNIVKYEVDLRGPWPEEQYNALATLQVELVDLIAQFGTALGGLDLAWTRAALHRTRLDEPDFLAAISACVALASNSLRTKTPMPYYHSPLATQFLQGQYRFRITSDEYRDARLPENITYDVLCSSEYLRFSCCVSLAFGIVTRLDRIVYITKKLCGERLYIPKSTQPIDARDEDEEDEKP